MSCPLRLTVLTALIALTLVSSVSAEEAPLDWAPFTQSPRQVSSVRVHDQLYATCGELEVGLVKVAAFVVGRRVEGRDPPTERQLEQLVRAAGVPQMWPRAWALGGRHDQAEVAQRLASWLAKVPVTGTRRCGIARGADGDGDPVVAVVTVDAVADLSPLPTETPVSRWLSLDATLLLPAQGAKVVLLGPRGRPKRVLASLSGQRLRSRFSLDAPGSWLVQVVATMDDGPRPVLEARVHVGVPPPATLEGAAEPDEDGSRDAGALFRLLSKARASEGLGKLRRDAALDAVARDHAAAMMKTRKAAHDVGQGAPAERAQLAGVRAHRIGENIASAPTIARVHRVLWGSPSHRENMLDASFRRVGIAIAIDRQGQIWAVQLFAS